MSEQPIRMSSTAPLRLEPARMGPRRMESPRDDEQDYGEERAPLVSIGLPVFNGESYLEDAIRTIVSQTFEDWELIIADNASTDGTREICAHWSEADDRIRWARTEAHTGAARNFNRAFGLARGTYFKWAAHDDLVEPTYLERCVETLQSDREIVLAHSEMNEINERGEITRELLYGIKDGDHKDPARRFRGAIALDHGCFDVFGVIRRGALAETKLIAPYLGSDRVLLAELALKGRFKRVPEKLFHSREHPERSIRMRSDREREQWFGAGKPAARMRPNWKRLGAVRDALGRARVSLACKQRCRIAILRWTLQQRGSLFRELIGRERPGDIREKEPPPATLPEGAAETPPTAS